MATNIQNVLKLAEQEYHEKIKNALNGAKSQITDSLTKASEILQAIPDSYRKEILEDASIIELIKSFESSPMTTKKARANNQKSRKRISDDELLSFLRSERTSKEIAAKFDLSDATVSKKTHKLEEDKKISSRKEGTSKYWKA